MKILSIRMKNLASLAGEHFIDFESEPLASSGLVAIIGKTGAGKSTILDAMCLALFNRVPRLKDSDGKLIDADGSELSSHSPQTVLRRGTGHGFAELCFMAQDQKVYMARWELKRARENPNAKLQNVQRSLKCVSDGKTLADKSKAVESQILRITQLSFEQFTRAVLLAQSEVTAFLKARDSERGELLEYLTNSSIFARVGQLAFEKTKQIATQRKELENILGHIELLSEQDVANLNQQLNSLNAQADQLEVTKLHLQQQQQWFEQQHSLQADIQQRQQYLVQQQQHLDALAPEKQQLEQLQRFTPIRSTVLLLQNLKADLSTLQPHLEQLQTKFHTIEQQFQMEQVKFQQIDQAQKQQHQFEIQHQNQLEQVRARIAERRVLAEQLLNSKQELKRFTQQESPLKAAEQQQHTALEQLQQQIQQLNSILEHTHRLQPLDDALSAHLKHLQKFIEHYQDFEHQYGAVSQAQQTLKQQQQQLEQIDVEYGTDAHHSQKITQLRHEREQVIQQLNLLSQSQQQAQSFSTSSIEKHSLVTAQNTLTKRIQDSNLQQQHAEQAYFSQKLEREQVQATLQKLQLLHTENIQQLRANLVEGEACLVCGSHSHPYISHQDTLSAHLLTLHSQQEQVELEKEHLALHAWQDIQKQHTQQTTALAANTQQLAAVTAQLQQVQTQLEISLSKLNIKFDFAQDPQVLEQLLTTGLSTSQQQQIQLEESLKNHECISQQRYMLLQSTQQTTQRLSIIKQAEDNLQPVLSLVTTTEQHTWQTQPLDIAKQVQLQLLQRQDSLKQLQSLHTQHQQCSQQHHHALQQLGFNQQNIQNTEKRIEQLTAVGQQNTDLAIQAILEMTHLHVEKPQDWLAQFEQQRQQLQQQFNQARQDFDAIRQDFETSQTALQRYLTQQAQLHTQQHSLQQNIQDWLNQHRDFEPMLLEQLCLVSTEQQQQLQQRVLEAERAYADAQSAINTMQQRLQQHLLQQPQTELEAVINQLTSLQVQLKQLLQQRDEVKVKLELHQRNLSKQHAYATQIQNIQTEEHRWNKISSLMGDATGKKFRDFAQQYHLDMLIDYANQQLVMLSQRYTLKRLDNSLSLAIIDHDMDGEMRSVASLSGGESFLTALALSLAIANMASGSMKIESLFIDEGFGTLDASSLHLVMNALDQLQSQGRKVVLISHIQEMHERIPVQIQVKPMGYGASTIEIIS